jgi:hypothetical protein
MHAQHRAGGKLAIEAVRVSLLEDEGKGCMRSKQVCLWRRPAVMSVFRRRTKPDSCLSNEGLLTTNNKMATWYALEVI